MRYQVELFIKYYSFLYLFLYKKTKQIKQVAMVTTSSNIIKHQNFPCHMRQGPIPNMKLKLKTNTSNCICQEVCLPINMVSRNCFKAVINHLISSMIFRKRQWVEQQPFIININNKLQITYHKNFLEIFSFN